MTQQDSKNWCYVVFVLVLYIGIIVISLTIPIMGYTEIDSIPRNTPNDYSEWTDIYLTHIIMHCIYFFSPIALEILGIFMKRTSQILSSLIYGISGLAYFAIGIASIVLYLQGKKNEFGKEWNEETIESVEKEYNCCFSLNGYARPDCVCDIAKEYNTTERFGNVVYNISSLYVEGSENQSEQNENENKEVEGSKKCFECSLQFEDVNQWKLIFMMVMDFVFCCCCGGTTVEKAKGGKSEKKKNNDDPYDDADFPKYQMVSNDDLDL